MIGNQIGNYLVLEQIGGGGMGQVFRAQEMLTERPVAIKALLPELTRDQEVLERFRQEAKILSRLNHPNIVMLYSFFAQDKRYYMAMEFAQGQTLGQIMKRYPKGMPWRQAIKLAAQVLSALEYAHSQDVIHRDIKPNNLIVQPNGTVKVMDFGVAKILGADKLTRTGFITGTLKYMSPEQVQCKPLDGRSDLYSTALVLYEILCGHAPFEEPSEYDLIRAQVEAPPPPLADDLPELPSKLESLVLRGLAKSPQDRFGSAWEFRQLLESVAREAEQDDDSTRVPVGAEADYPRRTRPDVPIPPSPRATRPSDAFAPVAPRTPFRETAERGDPSPATIPISTPAPITATAAPAAPNKWLYLGVAAGMTIVAIVAVVFAVWRTQPPKLASETSPLPPQIQPEPKQPESPATPSSAPAEPAKNGEIARLAAEIETLTKQVTERQSELHEQALEAARNIKHFGELMSVAPSPEKRLAFQASKYEAEYRFDRLTDIETQYMEALQGTQGLRELNGERSAAETARAAGDANAARKGFEKTLSGLKSLKDFPGAAQKRQTEQTDQYIAQLNGSWTDKTCSAYSTWRIDGMRIRISWPGHEPAEERILAVKDKRIYTIVETPSMSRDIYRYLPDGSSLQVENLADGRKMLLTKCFH
jgi:serine/threonine-protein kinase